MQSAIKSDFYVKGMSKIWINTQFFKPMNQVVVDGTEHRGHRKSMLGKSRSKLDGLRAISG